MRRTGRVAVAALALVVAFGAHGGDIYDPQADAWKQLEAAGQRAANGDRRVLAIVGGNWCKWCRALEGLMASDESIRRELAASFEVVHVNYSKENKNPAAMERLGNPEKNGFPVIVVLSPALAVLHTQETGSLETGITGQVGHDPAKVLAFLRAWSGAPPS